MSWWFAMPTILASSSISDATYHDTSIFNLFKTTLPKNKYEVQHNGNISNDTKHFWNYLPADIPSKRLKTVNGRLFSKWILLIREWGSLYFLCKSNTWSAQLSRTAIDNSRLILLSHRKQSQPSHSNSPDGTRWSMHFRQKTL